MHSTTKLQLRELNPHLLCVLCGGYLIDATTIIECIHSFCRTCIIKYLESSKYCPICDVQVHKTKPLLNVRSDKTLQTLVYKLVPSLFKDEMRRRREFYAAHPDQGIQSTRSLNASELRGEAELGDDFSSKKDDEQISLCLQSCAKLPPYQNEHLCSARTVDNGQILDRRYLLCPSSVTIGHLKKLIKSKFDLPPTYRVDIFYSDEGLRDTYTLLDVAHIYAWRRVEPLKLYYIVHDRSLSQLQLSPPSVKNTSRSSRDHRPVNKRSISLYTIRMSVSDTENTDSQTAKPETNDTLPKAEVQSAQSTNCGYQSSVPDGGGPGKQSGGSEQKENVNSSEKPEVVSDVDGGKETETGADGEKSAAVDGDHGDSVDVSGCHGVKDNRGADWSTSVSGASGAGTDKSGEVPSQQNDGATCKQTDADKGDGNSAESHCETGVYTTTDQREADRPSDGSTASTDQSHHDKDDKVDDQNDGETFEGVACAQTDGHCRTEPAIRNCEDMKAEVSRSTGVDSATPTRILSTRTNNNNKLVCSDKIVCSAGGAQTIADGRLLRKAGLLAAREPSNGGQRWLVPNRNQIQRCSRLVAMTGGRSVFLVSTSGAPCPGTLTAASVALVGQPAITCSPLTSGQPAVGLAGSGQHRLPARKNNHVINSRPAHACDSANGILNGAPPNGEIRPTNGAGSTTAKNGAQLPTEVGGQQVPSDTNALKLANGRESIAGLNRKRSRRDELADCASNKASKISRCSVGLDDPEEFRKVGVNMALEKHVTPQA